MVHPRETKEEEETDDEDEEETLKLAVEDSSGT